MMGLSNPLECFLVSHFYHLAYHFLSFIILSFSLISRSILALCFADNGRFGSFPGFCALLDDSTLLSVTLLASHIMSLRKALGISINRTKP